MRWIEHPRVKGTRRRRRRRPGAAAVEMALCLPLLLTLLVGTWEVGCMLEARQVLDVAAREAARQAGSGLLTNSQVSQVAVDYVRNALPYLKRIQDLTVTIKVYPSNTPTVVSNIDVSQAAALDVISVSLSIPYEDIRWVNLLYRITSATAVTGQASWVSLKDFPFPNTPPQPPQG